MSWAYYLRCKKCGHTSSAAFVSYGSGRDLQLKRWAHLVSVAEEVISHKRAIDDAFPADALHTDAFTVLEIPMLENSRADIALEWIEAHAEHSAFVVVDEAGEEYPIQLPFPVDGMAPTVARP